MLGGGAVAVALYLRRLRGHGMSTGAGARLGAMTGLCGFGCFAILLSLMLLIAGREDLGAAMRKALDQAVAASSDPQAQEMAKQFSTPEGLALLLVMSLVMLLVAFVVLGSIGGALRASIGPKET